MIYHIISHCLGCSSDDPCINDGTCKNGVCICSSNFKGKRCEYGNIVEMYLILTNRFIFKMFSQLKCMFI